MGHAAMRGHLREVAAEVLITDRPDPHPLRGPGDFQRKQEQEAEGAGDGSVPARVKRRISMTLRPGGDGRRM